MLYRYHRDKVTSASSLWLSSAVTVTLPPSSTEVLSADRFTVVVPLRCTVRSTGAMAMD